MVKRLLIFLLVPFLLRANEERFTVVNSSSQNAWIPYSYVSFSDGANVYHSDYFGGTPGLPYYSSPGQQLYAYDTYDPADEGGLPQYVTVGAVDGSVAAVTYIWYTGSFLYVPYPGTGTSTNQVPATTNVTLCVNNPTSADVQAYWNNNGQNQFETLHAGQTDCKTLTIPIINDGSYTYGAGWTPNPGNNGVSPNNNDPFSDTNGDGTLTTYTNFLADTNNSIGGSTNYVGNSYTNNFVYSYTNNITYPSSTGNPAQDPTLKAGFGQLHQDNQNLLTGLSVLHNDLNSIGVNTVTLTNELGQVITYLLSARTNNDSIPQIIGMLTNGSGLLGTNKLSVSSSNVFDLPAEISLNAISNELSGFTNFTLQFPTNLIGTNGLVINQNLGLTNYAEESTLEGISNLLSSTFGATNDSTTNPDTSAFSLAGAITNAADANSQSASYFSSVENTVSALISGLQPPTISTGTDPDMTVDVVGFTMDLNPLHNSGIAGIFALSRNIWTWLIALTYMTKIAIDSWKAVQIINETRGVNTQN